MSVILKRKFTRGEPSPLAGEGLVDAKRLLLDHYTVVSISEWLGYTHPSAFSNAFKRLTKLSPSAWYARNVKKSA